MPEQKWYCKSLLKHKKTVISEIQSDIDKLQKALDLIHEVDTTYNEAFQNKLGSETPTLTFSQGSVAMRLERSYHEIGWVVSALKSFSKAFSK
jgi:hypothetical protein